jgi:peptide/nickel transport system substrate-binding protein
MANVEVLGAIFEPLTLYDDHHRLIPCLATVIPTLANGGLRLFPHRTDYKMQSVWHLRPDARWSDGVPVTADDFRFTWQLILDPRVPAASREMEERIFDMESRDEGHTLVVSWKEPYAFAQEGHRHLVVPRHVEEPRLRALSGQDRTRYEYTPFNHEPVGNGPYRVAEWAVGRFLVLERQPFWHGPAPHLERIVYRFILEGETILANLDTGRIGTVSPVALDYDLAVEFDQRARARGDDTYVMHYLPGLYWEHIDFNTENPVTADRRVRQALTYGLNREAMCRAIFDGRVAPTDTWLPPLHPAAPPPGLVPHYAYDPERAARLLDEAGWKRGAGGVRFKDGKPLRLTLSYAADEPLSDRIAQMAREDWRLIGVELNLRPQDAKQFNDTTAGLTYQGLSLYCWVMDPSADGITFWTAANIPTTEKSAGQNACHWRNARSDALLQQATRAFDVEKRRALLWQEQRIWAEELPDIPLWFREEITIRHRLLRGWRPTGTETPVTWNCHEWRWEAGNRGAK